MKKYNKQYSLSNNAKNNISKLLSGQLKEKKYFFFIAGPAIISSISYIDPGNFATNIQAGSKYGYSLLLIVLLSNIIAMLFQSLSSKIGIVTGYNLAELCRNYFSKPVVLFMWIISEISAIATDVAEVLGGSIGLCLLFDISLLSSTIIIILLTFFFLLYQKYGFRPMELIIGFFIIVISICYIIELYLSSIYWKEIISNILFVRIKDADALFISVGIIGATVMPHALYLHSGLTQNRVIILKNKEKSKMIKYSNFEIVIALTIAGLINISILIMAASLFYKSHNGIIDIETTYYMLIPTLGIFSALIFAISLFISGLSSSIVGTMAGQIIMQGFVKFNISIWIRRFIVIIPTFFIVIMNINTINALIISQVILSITLPIPMITLLIFTGKKKIMGDFVNKKITTYIASFSAIVIICMNFLLLFLTLKEYIFCF